MLPDEQSARDDRPGRRALPRVRSPVSFAAVYFPTRSQNKNPPHPACPVERSAYGFRAGDFFGFDAAGSCGLAKPRGAFDKTCVGRRIAELRKAFNEPPHSVLLLRAPMRKCENRHNSRNKERCRKASYGQLRAMRSHRRALRERYRAPRLPPP